MGRIAECLGAAEPPSLGVLVELWRDLPHPRLAEHIERVGIARAAAIRAEGPDELIASFQAIARTRDPESLTALLQMLPLYPDGLIAISAWAPDPRIASAILALLRDPPYGTRNALPWWERALALLLRMADPRSVAALRDHRAQLDVAFARGMARRVEQVCARVWVQMSAEVPELDPADEAALAAVLPTQAGPPAQLAALEAAVYERPDDDALRLVFGDACTVHGDPRGEAIRLQSQPSIAADQQHRLEQVIKLDGPRWLGGLSRVLVPGSVRFRLGFLDSATLHVRHHEDVAPLVGAPRWATVRTLEMGGTGLYSPRAEQAAPLVRKALLHPVMRNLRGLRGEVPGELIIELCTDSRPRALRALTVTDTADVGLRARLYGALRDASSLPELSELIFRTYRREPDDPTAYAWLFGGALSARLQSLAVASGFRSLGAWAERLREPLTQLSLVHPGGRNSVHMERGAALDISARFNEPAWAGDEPFIDFCRGLGTLEPGSVGALNVSWPRRYSRRPARNQLKLFDEAVARLAPESVRQGVRTVERGRGMRDEGLRSPR